MQNTTNKVDGAVKHHPMPFVRLELVALCVAEGQLRVLLSRRQEAPCKGRLALPGGVLRIDKDSSLEAGAQRVAQERLGGPLSNLSQVCAAGGQHRDPRAPWALSVVYRSLVQPELAVTPGKRVAALEWHPVDEILASSKLAFDHTALLESAATATREQIASLRYPAGWIPEPFTLPELQAFSEAVLSKRLDKVTFRRRIESSGTARAVPGEFRQGGAHRPAQLFRLQPMR